MNQLQYANAVRQAQTLFSERRFGDAQKVCQQLLKMNRKSPEALVMLASIAWQLAAHEQTIEYLEQFLRFYPRDIKIRVRLSDYLALMGNQQQAIAIFEKVLKREPKNIPAITSMARCFMSTGELERANKLLEPFINQLDVPSLLANTYAALQLKLKQYDEAISIASRHLQNPQLHPERRREFLFTLGNSLEKIGIFDDAFQAYHSANSIDPPNWKPQSVQSTVAAMIEVFTPQALAGFPRAAHGSSLPIFITGMPRSGTTLVERIIASHPQVAAAGECRQMRAIAASLQLKTGSARPFPQAMLDYVHQEFVDETAEKYLQHVQALAPQAQRITDKHLGNFQLLGLIEVLFPNACIIDVRRDLHDNGLACYASMLGMQQPYTANLKNIGIAFRAFEHLMQHWHRVLSIPIMTVNYEDLVQDQELWTRRIIEFCDLPWHDDCLQFHTAGERAQSSIAPTLSYDQVRQPMYTSSVGRAGPFQAHLDPLVQGLDEGAQFWADYDSKCEINT